MHALLLISLLGAAPEDAALARQALQPFKAALKAELTRALEVSPVTAIEVCSKRAPELARAHSQGGVTVGRAALKRRNAGSVSPPWVAATMHTLAREPSGSEASRVVTLPAGRVGYAEAIWVQPMCLTCHGETLTPDVKAALNSRYPEDQATGFKLGDFRGVYWVDLPARRHEGPTGSAPGGATPRPTPQPNDPGM
jgi:hypothetical protein